MINVLTPLSSDSFKIHVDYLEEKEFLRYRTKQMENTGLPGEYLLKLVAGSDGIHKFVTPYETCFQNLLNCERNHLPEKCRCKFPIIHMGQDESCYFAYAMPKKVWKVLNQNVMRKKTEGNGVMISAVVDSHNGFGLPMTSSQIVEVNQFRASLGKEPIITSPGLKFFDYGLNKEGYWNFNTFKIQVDEIVDCCEKIHPGKQLVFEVDQSSGHTKTKDDGLTNNIGKSWGGSQRKMHPSVNLPASCIGTNQDKILNAGDTQFMVFQIGDPPPHFDPGAPLDDFTFEYVDNTWLTFRDQNFRKRAQKYVKKLIKVNANLQIANDKMPLGQTKHIISWLVTVSGYIGKPKGWEQILWECGMWHKDMIGSKTPREEKESLAKGIVFDKSNWGDYVLGIERISCLSQQP
jgi:hypothetical protein